MVDREEGPVDVNHSLDAKTLLELLETVRAETEAILTWRPEDRIVDITIDVAKLTAVVRVRPPD
jgi:hypothetical protein